MTLTGAAGSGKTRLAIEAAWRSSSRQFGRFVDLAGLQSPDRVLSTVASALDAGASADADLVRAIIAALRGRDVLLILDNCEHLIDACAQVVALLSRSCPSLVVLATSRTPLRISGETVMAVQPLRIENEAVALFVDRARIAVGDFRPNATDLEAIEQICRHLDGLPLAIELAATWIAVMSPMELLPLLEKRFDLLGGRRDADNRQSTLRAAVDWSYNLLSDEARKLFWRLSVFRGTFTRDAAEDVALDKRLTAERILPVLSALCETSMVVAERSIANATRYRMLETLREYAAERLRESGEEDVVRDRQLAYFVSVAETAFEKRMTGGLEPVVHVLEADRDNVRAALEWAGLRDRHAQMRLSGTLVEDAQRSLLEFPELRRVLEEALEHSPESTVHRARALVADGYVSLLANADADAQRRCEEACAIFARLGDRGGEAWARLALGHVAWLQDDLPRARRELKRSRELYLSIGNDFGAHRARFRLGIAEVLSASAQDSTRELLASVLSDASQFGDLFALGLARSALGWLEVLSGRQAEALGHFREGLRILAASSQPPVLLPIVGAALCAVDRDPSAAMRLLGFNKVFRLQHGLLPFRKPRVAQAETEIAERARAALGEAAAARAEASGQTMARQAAIELALSELGPEPPTRGRRFGPSPRTPDRQPGRGRVDLP